MLILAPIINRYLVFLETKKTPPSISKFLVSIIDAWSTTTQRVSSTFQKNPTAFQVNLLQIFPTRRDMRYSISPNTNTHTMLEKHERSLVGPRIFSSTMMCYCAPARPPTNTSSIDPCVQPARSSRTTRRTQRCANSLQ